MEITFDSVLPMVKSRANQFQQKGTVGREFDDLVQEGWLIFCEAQERYDADKGASFSSWYYRMLTSRFSNMAVSFTMKRTSAISEFLQETVAGSPLSNFHMQDLSEDAGFVCQLILDGVFTHITKTEVREYLYNMGWQVKRVNETFKEISRYIDAIC